MTDESHALVDPSSPANHTHPATESGDAERVSILREYFESAIVTIIMALFGMAFVVQAVKVPTGSMENNILIGDHFLVNKFIFGATHSWLDSVLPVRSVERGDVIVFKYPDDPETNYVKRVIGLPNETVQIRGTRVYINGQELPEHRAYVKPPAYDAEDSSLQIVSEDGSIESAPYRVFWEYNENDPEWLRSSFHSGRYGGNEPYTVPDHSYFVMGDNRDDSQDSRYWGSVPGTYVVGRALIVYWSYDERAAQHNGTNWLVDLFRYTRWARTGALIR